MKNIRKILISVFCFCLMLSLAAGCGATEEKNTSKSDSNTSKNDSDVSTEPEETQENEEDTKSDFLNDNEAYFFSINGEKFYAGDEISSLSAVGFNVRESELEEELPANKYMIGAGHMENSNGDTVFSLTPYNPSDSSVKVSESVIGGFDMGYVYAKDDETALNIEVYGGIKLGSTQDEVKEVFGEPTSTTSDLTTYYYESEEVYRSYKFTFDEEGKVSNITWKNLVFNE